MARSTTVIVEPRVGGHTLIYAQWVAQSLSAMGVASDLCLDERARDIVDSSGLLQNGDAITIHYLDMSKWQSVKPDSVSWLKNQLARLSAMQTNWSLHKACIEHVERSGATIRSVMLMSLDFFMPIMFFDRKWIKRKHIKFYGLLMRAGPWAVDAAPYQRRWRAYLRNIFVIMVLKRFGQLKVLSADKRFLEQLSKFHVNRQQYAWLPDAADIEMQSELFPRRADTAAGRIDILLYGHLGERKGIRDALYLVKRSPNFALTIVGTGDPDIEQFITDQREKLLVLGRSVRFINRYLPRRELDDLIMQSSVVWVAYVDFPWMSGVLPSAATLGVPVLARDYGQIGEYVSHYNLGVFLTSDPEIIRANICAYYKKLDTQDKLRAEFVGDHSSMNFRKIVQREVCELQSNAN